jgi:outer membrane lipoprotein-sorting protein
VKVAFLIALCAAGVRADSLDAVLARMDQAAKPFRSLEANVHKTDYQDVFKETTEEDATFKMMKYAKTGVVLLAEFNGTNKRTARIAGHEVKLYHPKANSVDVYDTRKFTKSADLLFLVGFGDSKAEIQKTYNVTMGASETIDGIKTTRIDLTPKSAEAKKLFNMIQLWIPEDKGNPIREKLISGKESKDYTLFQFSNMKIRTVSDPALPESEFELNLPKDVKTIKP